MADRSGDPRITGRGVYAPPDLLTNDDIASVADPSRLALWVRWNSWCAQRVEAAHGPGGYADASVVRAAFIDFLNERMGIRTRHAVDREAVLARKASRRGVWGSDLGAEAAQRALDAAGVRAEEVDVLVCGTSTPDRVYPATATAIQRRLGATRAWAFDCLGACSSFVFGLELVRGLLRSGAARRALVVAAEYFTCGVDYADPTSSYFWGDAGAAAVVEAADLAEGKPGFDLVDVACRTDPSDTIRTGLGGTRAFVAATALREEPGRAPEPGDDDYPWFFQNGPRVYRDVVPRVASLLEGTLARNGVSVHGLARLWMHQASVLMVDSIVRRLAPDGLPAGRVPLPLARYGNTSSCGAAIALAEDEGLAPGDLGAMAVFGAGYTMAAALLRRA